MIMPWAVSPSFMLDVSTAAIVVGSGLGFSGMGCVGGISCKAYSCSWLLMAPC